MNEKEWLLQEIAQLKADKQIYEVSAYLTELETIICEQYKRIEQAQAEIDGLLWSPKEW